MKVINFKLENKSLNYQDSLYAIQKQIGHVLYLWKIKDGKLDRLKDGTPNIYHASINNKYIHSTDLEINQ